MSKDLDFLKQAILSDSEGNPSKVIRVRGSEAGLDHIEILTQSTAEKEDDIVTKHRIYTEETTL